MSCSSLSQQLKREVNKFLMIRIISAGKVDRKSVWRQVFIRNLSIKIKSSRAVLSPIEKAESCCENVITGARKTLIVQVAE